MVALTIYLSLGAVAAYGAGRKPGRVRQVASRTAVPAPRRESGRHDGRLGRDSADGRSDRGALLDRRVDIDSLLRRIALTEPAGLLGSLIMVLICVTGGAALRLLLAPVYGGSVAFMNFIPAVIVAALWGGRLAGILVLLACVPVGWFLATLPGQFVFDPLRNGVATLSFLAVGAFVVLVSGALRRNLRAISGQMKEVERAKDQLSVLQTDLHAMVDQAAAGIIKCDLEGRILTANPRFCEIIGRSEGELIGHTTADFTHPDDVAASTDVVRRAGAAGDGRIEKRYLRPDGGVVWCLATARLAVDDSGRPQAIMSVVIDISDAKAAEVALRESEQRFRAIADTAPVMIWVTGADRRREFVNQAYVDFVGLDYDKTLELDWREVLHPDDADRIVEESIAGEATGRPFAMEARYRSQGRDWRWLKSLSRPRVGPDGAVVGFVGVAFDTTDVREAAKLLEESEARFRLVADSAPALIWMSDLDGRVSFANRRYRAYFGIDSVGLMAEGWRSAIHPEDVDILHKSFLRAAAFGDRFEATARVLHPTLGLRWLRCEGIPRRDADGRLVGYVGANIDITETKQAEEDLKDINELLEERVGLALAEKAKAEADLMHAQRMEAVGRLTGGVAHDFNNLLTVVIGALDMVQRSDNEARRAKMVDAALQAARRGERLTHQLLAFSRRQALRPEPVDLNDFIREGEPLLRQALGEAVTLTLKLRKGGAPVRVDPAQFEAAVINLLVNARDAVGESGAVTIETSRCLIRPGEANESPPGKYVCVTVSDNGAGMDATTLDRVFEPFFTTKGVGKGTGLGLSQVYGFARQSGGSVKIESAPGEGSRIRIYLPQLARAQRAPVAAEPRTFETREVSGRLLLVEDDPNVSEMAEGLLRSFGLDVTTASSGAHALDRLEAARFDMMLTDIVMPGGMTGVELARQAASRWPAMRIVLTSGYAGDDVDTALADSVWPFLRKPYSADDLRRSLAESAAAENRRVVAG